MAAAFLASLSETVEKAEANTSLSQFGGEGTGLGGQGWREGGNFKGVGGEGGPGVVGGRAALWGVGSG